MSQTYPHVLHGCQSFHQPCSKGTATNHSCNQYPLEDGGVDELKQSFWSGNSSVEEAFSFSLKLRSSYPIEGLRLPNHPNAAVNQLSSEEWKVELVNISGKVISEENINIANNQNNTTLPHVMQLNKDIITYWRHSPNLPASLDMITHKESTDSRGTFMMTLTPGDDLGTFTQGRDWIFILDISGSMQGKYHTLVEGVKQSLGKLNADDRFSIVLFNNKAHDLTNGYQKVTPNNIQKAL